MCAVAACALFLAPPPAHAQSSAYATVTGTVRGAVGEPIGRAAVTLTPVGGGRGTETATTGAGAFTIRLIRPGSYELRVEAIGYRPLVARTLSLSGGDDQTVELTLNPAPPPVLTVDTVALAVAAASRWRAGGVRFGDAEIGRIPHRSRDLASIVSLSTAFDESLGALGMPGDATLIVADGLPFYRAPHPTALAEPLAAPLFPAAVVGSVTPSASASEIEWPGAAGGYVGVATLASTRGDLEVGGAYSGDATWFSDELDFDTPSLLSYEATVRGTAPIRGGGSQLVVVADVLEHQTPLTGRLPDDVAAELGALDPDFLSRLTDPGVETYSRYAGLARLDLEGGDGSSAFVRGSGSYSSRSFEGAGPLASGAAPALADESVDVSLAGGYLAEAGDRTTVELRGGFSGSFRSFKDGPLGAAPAYLAESGSTLGNVPFSAAESSRTDLVLTPMIRHERGFTALKAGLTVRVSSHAMERGPSELSELLFTDAAALLAGRGFARATTAPEGSFGTQEYGVFAQYDAPVGSGLRVRLGGRYDFERIGADLPGRNTDWLATTGLANDDYPVSFHQLGLGGSITWDPTDTDGTRVIVSGSLREGDVDTRAIGEVVSRATAATSTELAGSGLDWPTGSIPASATELPTLTLFGPDTRAPRTTTLGVGLLQRIGSGVTLFVEGTTRRTDFLLRRRNVNLPVVAQQVDANGRPVYGTLEQDGALITATGDDARRFADFGPVWALDPDGWSEYRGATVGLEYGGASADFFGSYTYSETTDNRVGAASALSEARLRPGLPEPSAEDEWSEGVSDFDVPHRLAAGVTVRIGVAEVSGLYRYRSGLPFTPRYRVGVDANGDGAVRNDVAYVADGPELTGLLDDWPCLEDQVDGFAVRNSCRGPAEHTVDVRLHVRLGEVGGRAASFTVDGLNLVEPSGGVIDDALLLVDPAGSVTTSGDGQTVTVPVAVNEGFGSVLYPSSRGRMIRIGVRIGG